jgi:hypothetical protein
LIPKIPRIDGAKMTISIDHILKITIKRRPNSMGSMIGCRFADP